MTAIQVDRFLNQGPLARIAASLLTDHAGEARKSHPVPLGLARARHWSHVLFSVCLLSVTKISLKQPPPPQFAYFPQFFIFPVSAPFLGTRAFT